MNPCVVYAALLKTLCIINDFLWLSDEIGLQVPGDGAIFRDPQLIEKEVQKSIKNLQWPPKEILETMALAQHHGIPTRFLDFTRNGFFAAFFAALQCTKLKIEKEIDELKEVYGNHGLCVWAVLRETAKASGHRIHEHTVPRYGNKFLHAQNGLFLFDGKVNEIWSEKKEYPPMESVFAESFPNIKNPADGYSVIKLRLFRVSCGYPLHIEVVGTDIAPYKNPLNVSF